MKKIILIILTLAFTQTNNAQNKTYKDIKGKKHLIGKVTRKGLEKAPFKNWFIKNVDAYLVNEKVVEKLKDSLKNYEIKVFFGSWCGDSKKELPRFYKVLEQADFPNKKLEVIALDKADKAYKQSPNGEEKGLNIHRVPTFILYKDGKEVNRIVEHPKETIERDILKIINGQRYSPNYKAVSYIDALIDQKGLDSLKLMEQKLIPWLAEVANGSRELNTYGYVKQKAKEFDRALYIFDLNAKIFPHSPKVYDSLGEAYFETKKYTQALKNYYKVLSLKPEHKNAIKMIEKIKKLQMP